MELNKASEQIGELKAKVQLSIFGQERLIDETLCAFLSGGHILMTGAPGLAKTTLVRVFAKHLGLSFGRIQYTPDLLPTDIIGTDVLNVDENTGHRSFEFQKGPIFTNLLLADEINRATPRTQSAMLEAMQERHVTVGGKNYPLGKPFMVFATQNPFESEGTFPLPEAQLDRFLIHALVDYPDREAEMKILSSHNKSELAGEAYGNLDNDSNPLPPDLVEGLMIAARNVDMPAEVLEAIVFLVRSTRPEDGLPEDLREAVWYGAGPRAGISLVSTAKARALIEGTEVVRWRHIKQICKPVLRHRIKLVPSAERELGGVDKFIDKIVDAVELKFSSIVKDC